MISAVTSCTEPAVVTSTHLRHALAAIERTTAGMSLDDLRRHPDGKWSASEILEHLAKAFANTARGLERCLENGRPIATRPALKQRIATMVVVAFGHFPSGREAPERTRPKGIPPDESLKSVREGLVRMDQALAQCDTRFGRRVAILDHPILGALTVQQWRKFHWVHTRHHMKQIARLRGRSD
jgi:hypothetical protein